MDRQSTQVIVLGGSLVGLSASVFLAMRGVKHIVVEKHRGSSPLPRAMGFTEHTMEFYRAAGLWDRIPQNEPGVRLRRRKVESLAGEWKEESLWTPGQIDDQRGRFSPGTGAAIPQDKLEPILRQRALELGADLRLGTEMLSFQSSADGVEVRVRDRDSGNDYLIEAPYLIAADGTGSSIREQLGIERHGVGHIQTLRTILFLCPEADAYLHRGIQQFEVEQPGSKAFLTTYQDGRWMLMFPDETAERGREELDSAVRRALGAEMKFEVIATGRWEMAGRIAETYQQGRVFLAGDAAHQLPPTRGGFGANTGIEDVYNLAWKLDLVLRGLSTDELLKTYSDERQPIGWLRHQQTFARPDYVQFTGKELEGVPLYDDVAMELGQLARSTAVIGAGPDLPPARTPEEWAGQPGVRAPHAWITYEGQTISTVDLFTRGFVVLSEDSAWRDAAQETSEKLGIPTRAVIVGDDIFFQTPADFQALYGVGGCGATLIRPDGVVCWRTQEIPKEAGSTLSQALAQIASVPGRDL